MEAKEVMEDYREKSVLIVDDQAVNRKILEVLLQKEGYLTLSAEDGPRGRKTAEMEKPDLILLDYIMQGENGFDVIRQLKANSATSNIPILFITAVDDIETKIKAFELGAVDYIVKPYHGDEVKARVRTHIKLYNATKAIVSQQAEKLDQLRRAQTSMLVTPEELEEAKFGVFYESLLEAGGDVYEVLPISKDIFGYFLADVSGHDIETSFITASVKALLRQNCSPEFSPLESMTIINNVLCEILPNGKYLTACYVQLNRAKGEMIVVNMGHPPPVFIPRKNKIFPIELNGDVLGAFTDVVFGHKTIRVSKGDKILIYSDGLIETPETSKSWANMTSELVEVVDNIRDFGVRDLPRSLYSVMHDGGLKRADDDIVVLSVEV